jgi:hypothetical protein
MAKPNSTVTTLDDDSNDGAVVQAAAKAQADTEVVGKNADPALSGKKARIKIHQTSQDSVEQPFVFLGLNGFAYQVPRGKECVVPAELVEVLENALQKVYPTNGGIITGENEVPRHAFSAVFLAA